MAERLPLYRSPPLAAVETSEARVLDPSCSLCGMHALAKAVCVGPDTGKYTGPGGLLVVGESPGEQEDGYDDGARKGFPFIGASGSKLRGAVDQLWSGSVVYDNAIRCRPKGVFDNKRLMMKAAEACRGYLNQMLKDVRPSRIVTLGAWASYSVLGRALAPFSVRRGYGWISGAELSGAGRGHANQSEANQSAVPVFMVIHPAAALRNRFVDAWFKSDLRWALTSSLPKRPPWDATVRVVLTSEDAEQAASELRRARWVAFDTETFGRLFSPEFRLLCVALAGAGSGDSWVWGPEALRDPSCARLLSELLSDPRVKKVGQNEKFDGQAVHCGLGVEVRGLYLDTQLTRKLLDPDALARLEISAELVGMGGHKEENQKHVKAARAAMKKWSKEPDDTTVDDILAKPKKGQPMVQLSHLAKPSWWTAEIKRLVGEFAADELDSWSYGLVPRDVLLTYCARDAVTTALLGDEFEDQLVETPAASKVWRTMVRPASLAVQQVEAWGIAANAHAIKAFGGYLELKLGQVGERFSQYGDFNPDSTPQVRELLFKKLGLSAVEHTDTGLESTDADALEGLRLAHPVVADILAWRRYSKLQGTYAKGMLPHVRPDGRIHTSFRIDGARTGRLSSSAPNLQNLPRATTEEGKKARDCFVAPPGRVLIEADYCLAPGTRVVTADLRWVPVEKLEVGDEVIGFDEQLNGRSTKFRRAAVQARKLLRQPCYRVETDRGTVVASALHGWVGRKPLCTRHWYKTEELKPGMQLSFFADPWEVDTSWEGGYLAGFIDGEGWVSDNGVGYGQNEGPLLDSTIEMLRRRGFDLALNKNKNGCVRVMPRGEKPGLKFVGMLRPRRLLAQSPRLWEGCQTWGKNSRPANILSVEYVGEQDVVAVQTSTRTLIAEGFLSHNSQLELRIACLLSGDKEMLKLYRAGVDLHMDTAKFIAPFVWHIKADEVTKEHRSLAKAFVFGVIYGMTDDTIVATTGCRRREAAAIRQAIMGRFRDLQKWIQDRERETARTGESWTYWKGEHFRRRPLWQIADQDGHARAQAQHSSYNAPVQGTASDYCLASVIEVVNWILRSGRNEKLVLTVHDSILVEADEDRADEVQQQLSGIMTSWYSGDVPLVVDLKRGRSWGSLDDVEEQKNAVAGASL